MQKPERVTPFGYALSYFTSNSIMDDDSAMFVVHREKNGVNNMAYLSLRNGEVRDVSFVPKTPTHAYGTQELDTVLDESVSVDTHAGRAYYLRGRTVYRTDAQGNELPLYLLPVGTYTSCSHISSSGKKFMVATNDSRLFHEGWRQAMDIDPNTQLHGYSAQIRVIRTENGDGLQTVPVNRAVITHVQFHPQNDQVLLYNHEWAGDCGIRRIWIYDGYQHIQLRTEDEGRSRNDWTCHEVWAADGKSLLYHGGYCYDQNGQPTNPEGPEGIRYLGRALFSDPHDFTQYTLQEIPFPRGFVQYGHFVLAENGLIGTDGYYRQENDPPQRRGRYISLCLPDWKQGRLNWLPLCEHRSAWTVRSHPHPIFDHACRYLYFNSDFEGDYAVYRVEVPKL